MFNYRYKWLCIIMYQPFSLIIIFCILKRVTISFKILLKSATLPNCVIASAALMIFIEWCRRVYVLSHPVFIINYCILEMFYLSLKILLKSTTLSDCVIATAPLRMFIEWCKGMCLLAHPVLIVLYCILESVIIFIHAFAKVYHVAKLCNRWF